MAKPRTPKLKKQARRPAQRKAEEKRAQSARTGKSARQIRPGTKKVELASLLQRSQGATIDQMCAKTGWQAHSVRAALTGLRKHGLKIIRAKNDADTTVYRIESKPRRICS